MAPFLHTLRLGLAHSLPSAAEELPAVHDGGRSVRPTPDPVWLQNAHHGELHIRNSTCSGPQSKLEALPVEIIDQILSYLIHPRCRLPGLTQTQSDRTFDAQLKFAIRGTEDLTQPADSNRWAADLFSLHLFPHPFNALSLTSSRCHELIESYCAHLVRTCNDHMFNLPFTQYDAFGAKCVYPDLSGIVYRRLWLQHAPRRCVYCFALLDLYPFPLVKRVLPCCEGCFYRQTLSIDEVERQYHISAATVLASPHVRGRPNSIWLLRIDVEEMALQLYGTRAFHEAHVAQFGKPCSICAITSFSLEPRVPKHRSRQKSTIRQVSNAKKAVKRRVRCK